MVWLFKPNLMQQTNLGCFILSHSSNVVMQYCPFKFPPPFIHLVLSNSEMLLLFCHSLILLWLFCFLFQISRWLIRLFQSFSSFAVRSPFPLPFLSLTCSNLLTSPPLSPLPYASGDVSNLPLFCKLSFALQNKTGGGWEMWQIGRLIGQRCTIVQSHWQSDKSLICVTVLPINWIYQNEHLHPLISILFNLFRGRSRTRSEREISLRKVDSECIGITNICSLQICLL